jgi:activating signal cointegrator 1
MRGLTLTQPWATLVALGAKRVETRGWPRFPAVDGPIAIHAGAGLGGLKRSPDEQLPTRELEERLRITCRTQPFSEALAPVAAAAAGAQAALLPGQDIDWARGDVLPRGAIVAIAHVQGVERTQDVADQVAGGRVTGYGTVGEHERAFGDYRPGRIAIFLEHVVALPTPVPCRGALGLWELDALVERAVRQELHRAYELASAPLGDFDDDEGGAVYARSLAGTGGRERTHTYAGGDRGC